MVMTASFTSSRTARRVNVTDTRTVWQRMDWILVAATAGLLIAGTVLVWSATANNEPLTGGDDMLFAAKHLTNIAIGLVLMAMVASIDHRWVRLWAPVVYVGAVVGLALVLSPLGAVVNGSRSWIMSADSRSNPPSSPSLAWWRRSLCSSPRRPRPARDRACFATVTSSRPW